LDDLRACEYARLDDLNPVYLDYTGGGLYADSQLRAHLALLSRNVLSNPHSANPTSLAVTRLVEQARAYVLEYFNLRTGCFCNPGAGEVAHGLTKQEMTQCFVDEERMTFEQFLSIIQQHDDKSAGAIRISVGLATNFSDVYRFVEFAKGFLDKQAGEI